MRSRLDGAPIEEQTGMRMSVQKKGGESSSSIPLFLIVHFAISTNPLHP